VSIVTKKEMKGDLQKLLNLYAIQKWFQLIKKILGGGNLENE
jgi:hypothetical protein